MSLKSKILLESSNNKDLLKQVKEDLERIPLGNGKRKSSNADISGKTVTFGIKDLGDWRHDHGAHGGDDDAPILTDQSYNVIYRKYQEWAKSKSWYKNVKLLLLSPEEKAWLTFYIELA